MSHIVSVDVAITNLDSLDKAAKTLGFTKTKSLTRDGVKMDVGYTKNSAYFGVCKKANGSFELKSDLYYFHNMNELKQEYAKEEMLLLAYQKGMSVKSCKKNSNGEYQIELLQS